MKITKKHILNLFVLFIIFLAQFVFLANINPVQADDRLWQMVKDGGLDKIGSEAYDQSGNATDPRTITVNVIRVFLTFIGIIFMVLIILAGYTWMTAQGNEDKIKEAQSKLKTSIIGLIIIIGAWAITRFVVKYAFWVVGDTTWPPFD